MMKIHRTVLSFATAVLIVLVGSAASAQQSRLHIELNKLEEREGACRAYLVLENATERSYQSLRLDMVLFNPEGVVDKRLAVEAAPLDAGKTSLKVFDAVGLSCGTISRILLNDILSCTDAAGPLHNCLGDIDVDSRAEIPFIK